MLYFMFSPLAVSTHHILQRGSTKHLEHGVGFGRGDAQHDGLLAHSGGVLIQGGSQLPENTHMTRYLSVRDEWYFLHSTSLRENSWGNSTPVAADFSS